MTRTLVMLAAAAALLQSAPLDAAKRLKKGPLKLDPKLGYVLVRVGPTVGSKGKAPNLYIHRFDPARGELRTSRKADPARVAKGEDTVAVFGDRSFMATGEAGVFISSVTPGDYVIHGTESTCFCLGSYAFSVRPGEITDIGTVTIARENGTTSNAALKGYVLSDDLLERQFVVTDVIAVQAAREGDALPPEVGASPVTRAVLTEGTRFLNRGTTRYLYPGGLLINRAAGLPALQSGDGREVVARIPADDKEVSARPLTSKEKDTKEAKDGAKTR